MPQIDDLPTLTTWARKQTTGTAEQVEAFFAACDRARIEALDAEMRTVARALRRFVKADDELVRREWADTVLAAGLAELGRDGPLTSGRDRCMTGDLRQEAERYGGETRPVS